MTREEFKELLHGLYFVNVTKNKSDDILEDEYKLYTDLEDFYTKCDVNAFCGKFYIVKGNYKFLIGTIYFDGMPIEMLMDKLIEVNDVYNKVKNIHSYNGISINLDNNTISIDPNYTKIKHDQQLKH